MLFEELRFVIVLIGALVASYTDLKTGLIYDKITYPMITLGIIFSLADFITEKNPTYLIFPAVVFVLSYALYFFGKLGGGDVKIFLGIALLLPYYKGKPFFLSMLLMAALASVMVISIFYLIKLFKMKERPRITLSKDVIECLLLGIVLLLYFAILSYLGIMEPLIALLFFIPLLFALIFLALRKQIQGEFFLRWLSVDELEEDEIIAKEFLDKETLNRIGATFKGIITEKDKKKLKRLGIKRVPVYRDLPPFAPFILLGTIIAYFWPDFFLHLFSGI